MIIIKYSLQNNNFNKYKQNGPKQQNRAVINKNQETI